MAAPEYVRIVQEGLAAAQQGDAARALAIAEQLLKNNGRDPNAFQIRGLALAHAGRTADALQSYQEAARLAPRQPAILNTLGVLYKQAGDLARAKETLEAAVKMAPDFVDALHNLGAVHALLEDDAGARAAFERAIAAGPSHAEALAKFAHFLERRHDLERAHALATRALAAQPAHPVANLTLAEIDARADRHDAVVARLGPLLRGRAPSAQNASMLYGRLAKSLERIDRYDDAFEAFAAANRLQKDLYADFVARQQSPRAPDRLQRLRAALEEAGPADWSPTGALEGPDPVFLVGFPRSGTTMLEQILASHGGAAVLDERELLEAACTEFILNDRLSHLPALGPDDINRYRRAYWEKAQRHGARPDRLLIDKLPLDVALMGFIHRFFPAARFIFVIRDPRDAVLSCFQQTFAMNAAMYQFLELGTAAQYYDLTMGLGMLARETFPLRVHEVRYEQVIADFKSEIAPLLAFLGLGWTDAVTRFYETAQERTIRTPSAKQVIRKPYTSSIGKWRRYAGQMAAASPVLEPWVRRFGYAV